MFKTFGACARQDRAVAQAKMRAIIENSRIGFAQQTRDRAERAAKSAVEKHRIFVTEEFRDGMFQFAMKIGHARKHGRSACAQAVRLQSFMRSGDDFGMIRETEIIVGAKINDRARLAVVLDRGARIRRGQQFRLVKRGSPQAGAVPLGEGGRRFERILAVANEEIAQVEFCGIFHAKLECSPPRSFIEPSLAEKPPRFNSISRSFGAPSLRDFSSHLE